MNQQHDPLHLWFLYAMIPFTFYFILFELNLISYEINLFMKRKLEIGLILLIGMSAF